MIVLFIFGTKGLRTLRQLTSMYFTLVLYCSVYILCNKALEQTLLFNIAKN